MPAKKTKPSSRSQGQRLPKPQVPSYSASDGAAVGFHGVNVPLVSKPTGPLIRQVADRLTDRQAYALRALFEALTLEGETTATNPRILQKTKAVYVHQTPLKSPHQAISWLLDKIADTLEVSPFFPLENQVGG